MTSRVLLIGRGLFLDGLAHLLAEQPAVKVAGAVSAWSEAHQVMKQAHPDIVIVDHAAPELREHDLLPLLETESPKFKVIYLTLADSKMIVHDRQQLSDATIDDLMKVISDKSAEEATPFKKNLKKKPIRRRRKAKARI
ncbi:MAG: response regulator transcription factor [Chloroflexi bacterium]|nr:response regulator transcription factor [Chloroflexota bacterium]